MYAFRAVHIFKPLCFLIRTLANVLSIYRNLKNHFGQAMRIVEAASARKKAFWRSPPDEVVNPIRGSAVPVEETAQPESADILEENRNLLR